MIKSNKQRSEWEYLWYALYAFAGLGAEIFLLSVIEPALFPKTMDLKMANILHWCLTILCWGIISYILIREANRKMGFRIFSHKKPNIQGKLIGFILVVFCIVLNAADWGTLKIIGEFEKKGMLLFVFQYFYYVFEMILVYLIVVFGQQFFEKIIPCRRKFPWGGIVLCCTWGAVHIMSRKSISTGIGVMVFALLYGGIYLSMNRNTKYSYLAMLVAFVI